MLNIPGQSLQQYMAEGPVLIKFKRTQGDQECIELAYEPAKTVGEYQEDLAELFDCEPHEIKLVFKGKILTGKTSAEAAKISSATIMVVINQKKKEVKKSVPSKDQVIPGAGMSAGQGPSSSLGGVGAYQMVNHPQYMSAISQATDPDKIQEMMDDPQVQGMIEQMMDDPETLRQMLNENPMTRNMMKDNPMMQMVLNNPALLKMVFNKDTIKRTQEYMKNGGSIEKLQSGDPSAVQALMGNKGPQNNPMMGGMMGPMPPPPPPGMAGVPPPPGMAGVPPPPPMPNMPFVNPNPMMGSFGGGGMNNMGMMGGMNPVAMANFQAQMLKNMEQARFGPQLKQLELMGFPDRAKNLEILKQVGGDVDRALEKLCAD